MADKKISQLPAATTPLAGTEVLPIVQSSTTDQVSVANLTAGRVPAMNNAAMGFTSTASAAGTTTLTATSNHVQKLTGSTTQTYKLPDATTMTAGTAFIFDNDSTGLLTVVDNASGAVTTVASGSAQYVYLMTNATAAGTWGKYSWVSGAGALAVTTAKSASITNSLTLSGTDATTMTFPSTSASIARTDAAQTLTGTQTFSSNRGVANNTLFVDSGASGHTWQVGAADLLGGFVFRDITAAGAPTVLTLTGSSGDVTANVGNFVVGTSGKGIDFSADSHAAGMTSELLDDYEEGTWTPNVYGATTAGTTTYTTQLGTYTKVGRLVTCQLECAWSAQTGLGSLRIGNLPYTVGSSSINGAFIVFQGSVDPNLASGAVCVSGTNYILLFQFVAGVAGQSYAEFSYLV